MKTECSHVQRQLSAYLDHVLDPGAAATVTAHLDSCATCRRALADLEGLVRTIGAVPPARAPEGFAKRLHERLESESGFERLMRRLFVPWWIKLPLELATAAVAVLVIFFVVQDPQMVEKKADMSIPATGDKQTQPMAAVAPGVAKDRGVKSAPVTGKAVAPAVNLATPAGSKTAPMKEAPSPLSVREAPRQVHEAAASRAFGGGGVSEPIELTLVLDQTTESEPAARPHSPTLAKASAPGAEQLERKELSHRRPIDQEVPAADALEEEALSNSRDALPATRPFESAEARVRALAVGLGGSVTLARQPIGTSDTPVVLKIELPAARYAMFCSRLQSMGRFEHLPPEMDAQPSSSIRLLLTLRAP